MTRSVCRSDSGRVRMRALGVVMCTEPVEPAGAPPLNWCEQSLRRTTHMPRHPGCLNDLSRQGITDQLRIASSVQPAPDM